jgi:K+-sensing histidine kinase KdpD
VSSPSSSTRLWGYASAVAAVALTTAVGLIAHPELALGDIGMMYLPAVMLAALAGRGPALLAASLAVLAFDLCFVPPRFTIVIENPRHGVTFAVMFVAGLTIATLAERLRGEAASARAGRPAGPHRGAAQLAPVERVPRSAHAAGGDHRRGELGGRSGGGGAGPGRAARVDRRRGPRLERMLANLLQLTRVETGIVPTREWVPLDELIGGALTRLEPLLGERAVTVAVGDVEVEVDPVLFELALVNLIENAIKHGAPPIEIAAAARDGDRVELTVRDHGAGVAPADRERVFDKFFRASSRARRRPGLAVVRAIAVAHGGAARVEAPADGGAAFVIELPAARPPGGPP